jgi:uncharacterized protein YjiS (DUF1127 family)
MVSTTLSSGTAPRAGAAVTMNRILRFLAGTALALVSIPARIHRGRQLMRTLAAMDAHELADIGLSRQDLADSGGLPLTSEFGAFFASRAGERRHRRR